MNTANMPPLSFPAAIPAEYPEFNKYCTAAGKGHRDQINNTLVSVPHQPLYIHWMKVKLFPQYSNVVRGRTVRACRICSGSIARRTGAGEL